MAEVAIIARDMVNEPANIMTPTKMAEVASRVAEEEGLTIRVLDRQHMEELGMGALLGVAKGSDQPPKLIILEHHGDPGNPSNNIGFIGKGITFGHRGHLPEARRRHGGYEGGHGRRSFRSLAL